jgi:hypothetical protein
MYLVQSGSEKAVSLATWYSSRIPNLTAETAPTAAATPSAASWTSLAPAIYDNTTKTAPNSSAVPRSGWMKTRSAGTARMPRALRKTACSPTGFSAEYPASTITMPSLANSEGCTCTGPISTQRWAPPAAAPTTITAASIRRTRT